MSIIKGKTNVVAGFGGTKRPLGEVYFSQSSLATDNPGALPGWTGEYYENGKTLFPDLYNFVKAHSELQVTKTDYDNAIATYGECKKYVVDENEAQTSLRLPKYARSHGVVIKEKKPTDTDPTWYRQWSDGWLEQGGISTGQTVAFLKAFANTNYTLTLGHEFGNTSDANIWLQFAKGGKTTTGFTYANATTPANTAINWEAKGYAADIPMENTMYPWISAYTSAIPASVAQTAEFTNALTGKANTDLSNVLANIDYVVDSKVPTESDPSWYRKYKSGWLEQGNQTANIPGSTPTTVALLKPYSNTNYNVIIQPVGTYTKQGEANNVIPTRTTTNFVITRGQIAAQAFSWRAEGQGGGAVTPELEPTVLHKYKWNVNKSDVYCYTDLSRKEVLNLTGTYPKTPAYIESTSNTRINSTNYNPILTADGCVWKYKDTLCKLGTDGGTSPQIYLDYLGNILNPDDPFIDDK